MKNRKHFAALSRSIALGALLAFTHVAFAANPVITGANPNPQTGQITITGAGFLPVAGAPTVSLNNTVLPVASGYTNNKIVAAFSPNIPPGTYQLIVTVTGGATATFDVAMGAKFLPFNGTVATSSAAGLAVTNSAGTAIEGFGVGGYGVIAIGGASGANGVAGVSALGGGGALLFPNVANGGAGVSAGGAGGTVQGGDGVDAAGGMGGTGMGSNSGNGVSATGANSTNPEGFSGNGVYAAGGNGPWGGAGVYAVGGYTDLTCDTSGPLPLWASANLTNNAPNFTCAGPGVFGIGGLGAAGGVFAAGGTGSSTGAVGDALEAYAGTNGTGIYASGGGPFGSPAALFDGNVQVTGFITKASGSFQIDHPLDPGNQYLYHSFVESPDMKNIYDGTVTTDGAGHAMVTLPDWFEALNRDFRYQLTAVGQPADAWIASKIIHNTFNIRTDKPYVEVSWQVTGIRQDAWANAHRIPLEVQKDKADQGHYLHPELFGHAGEPSISQLHHPLPKVLRDRLEQQR